MKLLVDTHTHTVLSGHAYSTLKENAEQAHRIGMEGIVLADHGPMIDNCPPTYILSSITRHLPDMIEGVRVVRGIEANIKDHEGGIDIEDEKMTCTEFGIASMHSLAIRDGGITKNTNAVIGALNHPGIHVIGHPGNPGYPIDREAFVREVKRLDKLVEINNHSYVARPGSAENCRDILLLCKKLDVRVTIATDAHFCYSVGVFDKAEALLEECGFPEELVVSTGIDKFLSFIAEHR